MQKDVRERLKLSSILHERKQNCCAHTAHKHPDTLHGKLPCHCPACRTSAHKHACQHTMHTRKPQEKPCTCPAGLRETYKGPRGAETPVTLSRFRVVKGDSQNLKPQTFSRGACSKGLSMPPSCHGLAALLPQAPPLLPAVYLVLQASPACCCQPVLAVLAVLQQPCEA